MLLTRKARSMRRRKPLDQHLSLSPRSGKKRTQSLGLQMVTPDSSSIRRMNHRYVVDAMYSRPIESEMLPSVRGRTDGSEPQMRS